MYTLTIDFKRGHEFEGKQGGVYGRVWGAEREVESVLIKTVSKASKQHSCEKEREKEVESYHTWTCTSENYFFFLLWFPKPAAPFSFSSIKTYPLVCPCTFS